MFVIIIKLMDVSAGQLLVPGSTLWRLLRAAGAGREAAARDRDRERERASERERERDFPEMQQVFL